MKNTFPGGEWPTMLTPFTKEGAVDYKALEKLVEWYLQNGVSGLFAVCQSSEMFQLSLEERVGVAEFVRKKAAGRVPVIASGHISDAIEDQAAELTEMSKTGVDAVILITNRLAKEKESDEVWLSNLKELLRRIPEDVPLGFYECPYPYKRVMSKETVSWCAKAGRFFFLKDTCCDIDRIREKLEMIKGTNLKLYNANTSTLLESLRLGAAGYSGVMANFQPKLYAWLCENYRSETADKLSDELSICSLIERQLYPVNAKYNLLLEGLPVETVCRVKNSADLTPTFQKEVQMLHRITERMNKEHR
ncbi:dihydrodipicolinate synthase family protein [Caproicibacter sp.]|uniref:dihydrodipicolinate synthase family protein n=1 Tax=Caproicibacter sp. TaxID=2814884 RepID=UPI0039892115